MNWFDSNDDGVLDENDDVYDNLYDLDMLNEYCDSNGDS